MLVSELEELICERKSIKIGGVFYQIYKDPFHPIDFPYMEKVSAWWFDSIDTMLNSDEVYAIGEVKVSDDEIREFEILCNGIVQI